MDTWPSNATLSAYPLLQGGALTSATLHENEKGQFEWITAQNWTFRRKLVCNEAAVSAFPATQSPQLHQRTTSLLQRAEQGAHFLRTYYPDVDVPAELIREQVGEEAKLEDSLRTFDPFVGNLLTSFHVSDGTKRPRGFMAFPMGENGCDLNFSNVEFSGEGNIITEPSHYPAKRFETPICQIVSSPTSSDFSKETMVGVRTFSSTSLLSLSLPSSKQSKRTASIEVKEIDLINPSKLDGRVAVDVQIHGSLEYAALVNDHGDIFRHTLLSGNSIVKVHGGASDPENTNVGFWRIALGEHRETSLLISPKSARLIDFRAAERGVQLYSVAHTHDLLTSIESDPYDGLTRLVTTSELIWVDPRFHIRPVLAWKHEREYDRTLSSHFVGTRGSTWRKFFEEGITKPINVYDVSSNKTGLLQSHALPYSLSGGFPSGPHAGFHVVHPHPESGRVTTSSLVQLSSRGGIYQTALVLRQEKDTTPLSVGVDVSWSSAVHRLATTCSIQQPDIGKLGARAMQEIDFRQAYQRLFYPLDATEAVYPAENAGAVYQTLDMMPLFWQVANTANEHLLTTFDIAFCSGEEPTHTSRADFLTQSTLSSRRGFRALTQGRVSREVLIKGAAWYVNLEPVLQMFVPDISGDVQSIEERLRRYDLVLDDYRSGSSLRRESEAREQLAVDLILSRDVYSAQSFAKAETEVTEGDEFETMSRAAEAMTLSETLPSVHFGYLSPVPCVPADPGNPVKTADVVPTGVALPPGVRLLLGEWETITHPDQYAYHDPYDDQQPVATSLIFHHPTQDRDGAQATQSQQTVPTVIAYSRAGGAAGISNSQPISSHLDGRFLDSAGADIHTDSLPMASTQILPGPFGGRLPMGKKKGAAGKRRVGGF